MISPISMLLNDIYMLMASKFIFLAQISLLNSRPVYLNTYLTSVTVSDYSNTNLTLSLLFSYKSGPIPGFSHLSECHKHTFNLQTSNLEVIIDAPSIIITKPYSFYLQIYQV